MLALTKHSTMKKRILVGLEFLLLLYYSSFCGVSLAEDVGRAVNLREVKLTNPVDSSSRLAHLSVSMTLRRAKSLSADPTFVLELKNVGNAPIVIWSPLLGMKVPFYNASGTPLRLPLSAFQPEPGAGSIDTIPSPVRSLENIPRTISISAGDKTTISFVYTDSISRNIRSLIEKEPENGGLVKCYVIFSLVDDKDLVRVRMLESDLMEVRFTAPETIHQ
jgi:hypothetical protein